MLKRLTHSKFLEKLYKKNEAYRNGSIKILGEYQGGGSYILVEDRYGIMNVNVTDLLRGRTPTIQVAIDKTQYYINRCNEVHGSFYDYSLVEYKGKDNPIDIICPIHQIFSQVAGSHVLGAKCKKCADISKGKARTDDARDRFKLAAAIIHNNKYDYSLIKYINSSTKVDIICPIHGAAFKQKPNAHITGKGCPLCASEINISSKSGWLKTAGDRPGIFYILKCYNEDETFYKVGLTCRSIEKRYCNLERMPYMYEVIKKIVDFDKSRIYDLEKYYLKELKDYHYTPKIKFGGANMNAFHIYLMIFSIH